MNPIPVAPEAKLWELLRRNKCFRKTVARLTELDARARTEETMDGARWTGFRIIARCESNPFAALALRWLVPNPLFLIEEIALPPDIEATAQYAELEITRVGWNFDPEQDDGKNWNWFASSGHRGWPMRWGPEIKKVVTKEPRLKHECVDHIAEWRAYFNQRTFNLDTPWHESPAQFQRTFTWLWSQMLGSSHGVHETDFFKGWNPASKLIEAAKVVKAANECIRNLLTDLDRVKHGEPETVCPSVPTKDGNSMRQMPQVVFTPSEDDLARMFRFDDLARMRVFAVPHALRRKDVEELVQDFRRHLLDQLPDDHDLLGTKGFWETCLAVEEIERRQNVETVKAVGIFVRQKWARPRILQEFHRDREKLKRWYQNGALLPPPPKKQRREYAEQQKVKTAINSIFRTVDRTYRSSVKARIEFIRKLSVATFPRLNLEILSALPPHKPKKLK